MKEKLVTQDGIKGYIPSLDNKAGERIIRWGMSLLGLNRINKLYDRCKRYEGVEFCECALGNTGVMLTVENEEVLEKFKQGAFITVSNHPYGHLDALAVIYVVGQARPDYKVTANFILGLIDTMADNFIRVNPYGDKGEAMASGADSVRRCLEHTEEGHPLGCFPAGAVSLPKLTWKGFRVEDGPWKPSTMRMIRKADVPVIPIWISGQNSWIYNLLGMIGWQARTIRLPHELINKRGRAVKLRFGEPVMPGQLGSLTSGKDLAQFLKNKVYELADKK